MKNKHFLRGMATVNFWADDVVAARDWYAQLFGVEAIGRLLQRAKTDLPRTNLFREEQAVGRPRI
jgi:hypothetical protein